MRRIWLLLLAHVAALTFGLAGILIALPNPHLWAGSQFGADVFQFGMTYGGATHIVFGAIAMLAFGVKAIGWRKTGLFFGFAVSISLSAELIGTTTGWPFGEYAYTEGLGTKVLGKVPFTIPLSWFYLGFASYILALSLTRRLSPRRRSIAAVVTGVYLLVVWDLVLDPAMAHENLPVKFWQWFDSGPYYGMPTINFAGWALTGLWFIGLTRLAWRDEPNAASIPMAVPYAVYLANTLFAMALSLSVDLWGPVLLAGVLGVVPATYAVLEQSREKHPNPIPGNEASRRIVHRVSSLIAWRRGEIVVDGVEHLPSTGPAIVVARHYHHLYDGCALAASSNRPLHIVVGLDWVEQDWLRKMMERACGSAGWPVLLRRDALHRPNASSAYRGEESIRYLRRAVSDAVDVLHAGELLVMFPEAYPTIDPGFSPEKEPNGFLPFRDGFARIAHIAERHTDLQIPIIPAGLAYEGPNDGPIHVRFGAPVFINDFESTTSCVLELERQVAILSRIYVDEPASQLKAAATQ